MFSLLLAGERNVSSVVGPILVVARGQGHEAHASPSSTAASILSLPCEWMSPQP
jgi:hypothetical protein